MQHPASGLRRIHLLGRWVPLAWALPYAMIFVAPKCWGEGIGGRVVEGVLKEACSRGYERAQYGWTRR